MPRRPRQHTHRGGIRHLPRQVLAPSAVPNRERGDMNQPEVGRDPIFTDSQLRLVVKSLSITYDALSSKLNRANGARVRGDRQGVRTVFGRLGSGENSTNPPAATSRMKHHGAGADTPRHRAPTDKETTSCQTDGAQPARLHLLPLSQLRPCLVRVRQLGLAADLRCASHAALRTLRIGTTRPDQPGHRRSRRPPLRVRTGLPVRTQHRQRATSDIVGVPLDGAVEQRSGAPRSGTCPYTQSDACRDTTGA